MIGAACRLKGALFPDRAGHLQPLLFQQDLQRGSVVHRGQAAAIAAEIGGGIRRSRLTVPMQKMPYIEGFENKEIA